jgi:type II secretory ATPase GspE/PulE/Tfp pilus assembly ATPase PilB-like protein
VKRANALDVKRTAQKQGMKTLRRSGWERVRLGYTTSEEVLRMTVDM